MGRKKVGKNNNKQQKFIYFFYNFGFIVENFILPINFTKQKQTMKITTSKRYVARLQTI